MKGKLHRLLCLAVITALAGGCVQGQGATPSEGLRISTQPEGATVVSSYGDRCITPCIIYLPTDEGGSITVSKRGYEQEVITIGTKFDAVGAALEAPDVADPAALAVSAVFLGAFGDGMYKNLDRNRIEIVLTPIGPDAAESSLK